MATIKDIAQKAGVSIGTVDRVLHDRGAVNEQTKQRVLQIVKELDYQPNTVAQGLAVLKKKLKLGFFIPDDTYHPFFGDLFRSAESKAKELEKYGVQVVINKIFLQKTDKEYWEALKNQVTEFDGLVLVAIDVFNNNGILDEAKRAGVPVVFTNRYFENVDFLAYVGCDYEQSGRLAAGLCALSGGEDAKVCIYSEYYDEEETSLSRLGGFKKEKDKRYPNMKIVEQCQIVKNSIDNYISVKTMLEKYPDTNIIYVMNPGDYGICEAIYKADEKHQLRIITNDLVEEQAKMMRKGMISATVCQEPDKQGALPLDILFQYLAYNIQPEEKMCYTNLSIRIEQNI